MNADKLSLEQILNEPVAVLRRRFLNEHAPLPHGLLAALESDPRRGAQLLARSLRTRERKARAEAKRLHKLHQFEKS